MPSEVGDHILRWLGAFRPHTCLIESAQADVGMVSRISDGIRAMGLKTEIRSYRAQGDEKKGERGKAARIEALEPLWREGKVWLHRGACNALVEEYNGWPDVDHDDAMDALSMQRKAAVPSRHSSIEEAEGELEDDPEEEDSPWVPRPQRQVIARVGRSSLALRA